MAVPTVEVLSMVQPATVTVPETVAPEAGISMCTVGITAAVAATVTVTLAEPVSAGLAESAAVTVMV
jgi:hypothetical protein